jgi:tRNA threonylcarbamoyladenosine biosynthesis protein TsaE
VSAADELTITSADQMHRVGLALANYLLPGDLVVLTGPVGAGKTTLTQGIAAGYGVTDAVTSPTFVIAREYTGERGLFIHVDAYRLGSKLELDDLDLVNDTADAVTVIEWGADVVGALTDTFLHITLARVADPDTRTMQVHPVGGRWADVDFADLHRMSA